MSKFVKVTPLHGGPMLLPVDGIRYVESNDTPGCTVVYRSTGIYSDFETVAVMQSLDDMQARLNGEGVHICRQLHPDVTDVRVMSMKAHPGAIGWIQNPELLK